MLRDQVRILTAEDLAQVLDRKEHVMEIPEWGGAIVLRTMTLHERDEMLSRVTDNGRVDGRIDPVKMIHNLVIYGVAEPKFTEDMVASKSFTVIDRIATEVLRLNGMEKGAALTASGTFQPESGPGIPVPPREGSGQNGHGGTA